MASFNSITIVGNLGRDPETREVGQTSVCSFSVATTERKGKGEDREEHTTWFRVNAWGKTAEVCQQYLAKGNLVYVQGSLSEREYTDKDGNKRHSLEVNATSVQFLTPKSQSVSAAGAGSPLSAASIPEDDIGF